MGPVLLNIYHQDCVLCKFISFDIIYFFFVYIIVAEKNKCSVRKAKFIYAGPIPRPALQSLLSKACIG